MNDARFAANAVILTGVATMVTAALLIAIPGATPPPHTSDHPSGFTNTMLWFELAKDAEEVFANLGPADDELGRERRTNLDSVNRWDFAFMIAYSAFNGALVVLVWTLNRGTRFWKGFALAGAGMTFAALMLLGDIFENIQLLRLTGFASAEDVTDDVMRELNVWTRVKWGAIFAESIVLAWGYASYFIRPGSNGLHRAGFVVVLAFSAAAATGITSIAVESMRNLLELSSLCIAVGWLSALIHGFAVRFSKSTRP